MEEQFLFTQIHEALDIPTPPGAYERLRSQLTKKPVRPRPWPVLQVRTSSMGFRLAAGLAVVAIAVAAVAAVVVIHNASSNVAPAGPRMSIQAYQKMIDADFQAAGATYSSPCDVGVHSGCGADATRAFPVIQRWITDSSRQDIPARFVVINADIKQRLLQNLTAQRQLLAASEAGDGAGMDRAYWIALYGAIWTSQVVQAIDGSREVGAATYMRYVASENKVLDNCGLECGFTGDLFANCTTAETFTCKQLFDDGVGPHFDGYEADLIKEVAPPSLRDKESRLQHDLAQAGAALMTLRVAIAANDQVGIDLQIKQLQLAKTQIDVDAARITG